MFLSSITSKVLGFFYDSQSSPADELTSVRPDDIPSEILTQAQKDFYKQLTETSKTPLSIVAINVAKPFPPQEAESLKSLGETILEIGLSVLLFPLTLGGCNSSKDTGSDYDDGSSDDDWNQNDEGILYDYEDEGSDDFEVQGSKWDHVDLSWCISDITGDFDENDVVDAVQKAADEWASVSPLTFTYQSSCSGADIEMLFATDDHGDDDPFDGAGGVLAHAYYPEYGGDVHYDDDETWTDDLRDSSQQPIDLQTVALHELGHSLGLKHSSIQDAIMYTYYGGSHRELHDDDIQGIQNIYGEGDDDDPPDDPPEGPEETVYLVDVETTFVGEEADDRAGYSVATGGDINNDGYGDFVIGAPGDSYGIPCGKAYVYYGNAPTATNNLSNADVSIIDSTDCNAAGRDVAGGGDVNGDGRDDVLILAPSYDNGSEYNNGKAYLFLGSLGTGTQDISTADATFIGEAAPDWPYSLRGNFAGDLDRNGSDELVFGSAEIDYGDTDPGKAYIEGSPISSGTHYLSGADVELLGHYTFEGVGGSISGAGDVDGDSYEDILVGTPAFEGGAYLLYSPISDGDYDINDIADVEINGEGGDSETGYVLAGPGDLNGDGYDDILIGAPEQDDGGTNAGKVYLIFGPIDSGTHSLVSYTDLSLATFYGNVSSLYVGISVATGDVNGDGNSDLVIGASSDFWGDSDSTETVGGAYLFHGPFTETDYSVSSANATFVGENEGDHAGHSVAGAGDVNRDGYDDFIIGAPGNDQNGDDAGKIYLIYGGE